MEGNLYCNLYNTCAIEWDKRLYFARCGLKNLLAVLHGNYVS